MSHAPSARIGDTEVVFVSDGLLATALAGVGGLPPEEVRRLAQSEEKIRIPVNNFVLRRPGGLVMIDAGASTDMQPTLGTLPAQLRGAGIEPDAITHILLTHLHPDHANGLIDVEGRANFPNAEVVVAEQEAAFWLRPAEGPEPAPVARNRERTARNLAPYQGRVRRVAYGTDVLGFTPLAIPGHTPGHTGWRFAEGREAVLFWGDTVHLAAVQLPRPDAWLAFDIDPQQAVRSRQRMLDMAATDGLLVGGAHVTAPGLGRIVRAAEGYAFERV